MRSRHAATHGITADGIILMILLGPGARLAGVCALNVDSTCVAIVLVFVAFDGMFRIGTSAAVVVVVVVVVVAIVVVAIVS